MHPRRPMRHVMRCGGCGNNSGGGATAFARSRRRPRGFSAWSRAAAKYAKARLRDADLVSSDKRAALRLRACESCELRTVDSDGVAHCGRPMLSRPLRDPLAEPGCGCPLADKAADPSEHCPLPVLGAAGEGCPCKWCRATRDAPRDDPTHSISK